MKFAVAVAAILVVGAVAQETPYTVTVTQQGNLTIPANSWSFTSTDGQPWSGGTQLVCDLQGKALKVINAGTIKYQFWQEYEQHFIAQDSQPYFKCDNKGCDPTSPIALTLSDPFSAPSDYEMKWTVTLPAGSADKPKSFHMVMWGVDQDHTPYDFTVEMHYNFTTTA